MAKKFYIWKDPVCAGRNIEWREISGQEYNALIRKPENANRRFVILRGEPGTDEPALCMEATEEQYQSWRKEHNRHYYLRRINRDFLTVSLDGPACGDDEDETLHDRVGDEKILVEDLALENLSLEMLDEAINELAPEEKKLLDLLYFRNREKLSEREIARRMGIPAMTLHNRKRRILKKLQ